MRAGCAHFLYHFGKFVIQVSRLVHIRFEIVELGRRGILLESSVFDVAVDAADELNSRWTAPSVILGSGAPEPTATPTWNVHPLAFSQGQQVALTGSQNQILAKTLFWIPQQGRQNIDAVLVLQDLGVLPGERHEAGQHIHIADQLIGLQYLLRSCRATWQ